MDSSIRAGRRAGDKALRRSLDHDVPTELVLELALLDILEGFQQLQADGPGLAVVLAGVFEFLASRSHGDALHGDQAGGCPRGHDLGEVGEFFVEDRALLDREAEDVAGDLADGVAGHGFDDVFAVGYGEGDFVVFLLDADEAGGGEFVNLRTGLAVQVKRDAESFAPGLVGPPQHRGVVAAEFCAAGALGRGTIIFLQHERIDRVEPVVDSCWHHEDDKGVLVAGIQC